MSHNCVVFGSLKKTKTFCVGTEIVNTNHEVEMLFHFYNIFSCSELMKLNINCNLPVIGSHGVHCRNPPLQSSRESGPRRPFKAGQRSLG